MAKATQRRDDAPSEADSYERATAFLSGWIEDSFLIPTAKATQPPQHHQRRFSPPVPDLPLPSGTLRRRNTFSDSNDGGGNTTEEAINSLVSSLRTSLMLHEQHQNQNRSSQRGIASPSCVGAVFGGGVVGGVPPPPFARPTVTQQPLASHQQGEVAPSRRSAAASTRSTRRRGRSTEDDTARPQSSDIKNKHGSKQHSSSSSSKHERSSKRPPYSRRHTIDCDRSITSSNSSCASIIPPSRSGESLLRERPANIDGLDEGVLHFSVSMSSLYDRQRRSRSSSRRRVHWSSRSDDDLLSPSPRRHHSGDRSKKEDPPTMVVSLPWTDHAGNAGHYTGEVNTLIQPHGSGALQYDCGKVVKGLWNNGNPTTRTSSASKSSPAVAMEAVKNDGTTATASGNAPTSRKKGDEKKSSSKPSNHPTKTKSSRKKSKRHTNKATEDKLSTAETTKSTSLTQPPAQPSLDRLSDLDGPPNFDLGDTFHSSKYQIIESNPTKALHLISQLRIHDFAWILRSSREWTYAIIADFPEDSGEEASIRFVIDKLGNTKTLKMKHWAKCIRLVDKSH